MKCIAIIPARGGSKRIPRKNIRPFAGRPIIEYPIAAALAAGCFDEVMVSTDDAEFAEVAKRAGAGVPFLRSAKNSDDHATTADVLIEVMKKYRESGRVFDLGCCIYPFAALVTPERLREGLQIMHANPDLNGAVPVLRFGYPIQRALRIKDNLLDMIDQRHQNTMSQDLEPAYHDAGQYYWFRWDALVQARTLLGPKVAPICLGEMEAQDIDNEDDWRLAELKYQMRQAK
jgi:pseudaminic acid cytidylyltransferase